MRIIRFRSRRADYGRTVAHCRKTKHYYKYYRVTRILRYVNVLRKIITTCFVKQ